MKLRPRPWLERWERQSLKGIEPLDLPQKFFDKAEKVAKPWEKYDLMLQYRYQWILKFRFSLGVDFFGLRKTIPAEEQEKIYAEVHSQLQQQDLKRKMRRRRGASSD